MKKYWPHILYNFWLTAVFSLLYYYRIVEHAYIGAVLYACGVMFCTAMLYLWAIEAPRKDRELKEMDDHIKKLVESVYGECEETDRSQDSMGEGR